MMVAFPWSARYWPCLAAGAKLCLIQQLISETHWYVGVPLEYSCNCYQISMQSQLRFLVIEQKIHDI